MFNVCFAHFISALIPIVIIQSLLRNFVFNYIFQSFSKVSCWIVVKQRIIFAVHIAHNWTILVERKMWDKFVALKKLWRETRAFLMVFRFFPLGNKIALNFFAMAFVQWELNVLPHPSGSIYSFHIGGKMADWFEKEWKKEKTKERMNQKKTHTGQH